MDATQLYWLPLILVSWNKPMTEAYVRAVLSNYV